MSPIRMNFDNQVRPAQLTEPISLLSRLLSVLKIASNGETRFFFQSALMAEFVEKRLEQN